MAAEGKAIARVDDLVIFMPFGAPGDVVDVRIRKSQKRFLEGEIIHFHQYSSSRVEHFCEHFGVCGGCKWQHLDYQEQLYYKQQQVADSITRIGKIPPGSFELLPIVPSDQTQFYRNKLEFTFSNRRWLTREDIQSEGQISDPEALGFHIPGFFDKVLDINKCWLQPDPSNAIRLKVKEFALKNGMTFHDFRDGSGLLRNIFIRTTPTGQTMVMVVFGEDDPDARSLLLDYIAESFPQVSSLVYFLNTKKNTSLNDLEPVIYKGMPYIIEEMEGLKFYIGPKSFFQTNSRQAYKLYTIARDFAGLSGREVVYDLYTGTGTIANFVASHAQKVVGIEYVDEAVAHARQNASNNGITNTNFFAGDMAKVFNDIFMDKHGYPHVIITDPPRAGMSQDVVKQIIASGADRIVYVSCNPATQARDLEWLSGHYVLAKVQPVDMFPHTHHVESVALLIRRGA